MKFQIKLLLLVLTTSMLMIIIASCSNEQIGETTNTPVKVMRLNQNDLESATRMYEEMMESNEYRNFTTSIEAFNAKLVVDAHFRTKTEWMGWIPTNLGRTRFDSAVEFEVMLDNMYENCAEMQHRYSTLFSILNEAEREDLAIILSPELYRVICTALCTNELNQQLHWMFDYYVDNGSPLDAYGWTSNAQYYHWSVAGALATYAGCVMGCV